MGLNTNSLSAIKSEELLNGISTKSDMIIELLQGIQNPETATFTIQGFHKTVDINEEQTIEAPEGRYFSKIISINNSTSDNSTVKFNKALGGFDIPEDTSKLIKGLNSINMNCQIHSITINTSVASSYTVVAETKPYRYTTEIVNQDGSSGGYILKKGDVITDISGEYNTKTYSFKDTANNEFYFESSDAVKNELNLLTMEDGSIVINSLPYIVSKDYGECWIGGDLYVNDSALGYVRTSIYPTIERRTYHV